MGMKWMWMTTFLLASVCVQAQELNGKITDEKTGEVIPYVNVGVAAKGSVRSARATAGFI